MDSKITVEWYPAGEDSPFPDNSATEWNFVSHEEFKEWVQGYVCQHCLIDFLDFRGKEPETLKDWLDMGCGCEIGITDNGKIIKWDDQMKKTEAVQLLLDEYKKEIINDPTKTV